jgi:hypothetical protein
MRHFVVMCGRFRLIKNQKPALPSFSGSGGLALVPQFHEDNSIMTYRDRLNHWAVVRLLPNFQRVVVNRFRSRSDAEGHAQAMRRLIPDAEFVVVFDPVGSDSNDGDQTWGRSEFSQLLEQLLPGS